MNAPAGSASDPAADDTVGGPGTHSEADLDQSVEHAETPHGLRAARPPALRALDASMGLLREIETHPLDPGYAEVAERHVDGTATVRQRAATLMLTAGIAVIMVTAVLALRAPEPDGEEYRRRLLTRVETLNRSVALGEKENAALRREISLAEEAALGPSGAEDLARIELLAGQTPVEGPGVVLTLDDAPGARDNLAVDDPTASTQAEGLVQDRDLQAVVNGLWAAGAEALAVNNQRLTATSAIRSAGSAILVDYRPLSPPYMVSAIGAAADVQAEFAAGEGGAYVQYLQNNYGIRVTIDTPARVRVPGSRAPVLRYARPVTPAAAPARSDGESGTRTDASSEDLP